MQNQNKFVPFKNEDDALRRILSGEFDDWENIGEEAQNGVMGFINAPPPQAPALSPQQIAGAGMGQANQLGMSGLKDMSTPNVQGLMGMARAPQQQKQPFQMRRGLMGF